MIFLHELGHYLTAKWAGMKVTEFFIGFGPRIWSFRGARPSTASRPSRPGAYVKIIGMNNLEEVDPSRRGPHLPAEVVPEAPARWPSAGSAMHFLHRPRADLRACSVGVRAARRQRRPTTPARDRAGECRGRSAGQRGRRGRARSEGDRIVAVDGAAGRRPSTSCRATDPRQRRRRRGHASTVAPRRRGRRHRRPTLARPARRATGRRRRLGVPRRRAVAAGAETGRRRSTAVPAAPGRDSVRVIGDAVSGLGRLLQPVGPRRLRRQRSSRRRRRAASRPATSGGGSSATERRAPSDEPAASRSSAWSGSAPRLREDGWPTCSSCSSSASTSSSACSTWCRCCPFDGGHVAIADLRAHPRVARGGRRYFADVAKLLPAHLRGGRACWSCWS